VIKCVIEARKYIRRIFEIYENVFQKTKNLPGSGIYFITCSHPSGRVKNKLQNDFNLIKLPQFHTINVNVYMRYAT
jgi:hypothetical protein